MAQTRKNSILPLILVLVCAAVMLRSAFTGLEIDEEYALSLGYRLVSGDRLFYDMWEPHQLSSLPAAALLAMFIGITGGTTGVLVFFRLVVLACKAGMSYVFYREFRRDLGKPAALLAALAFGLLPEMEQQWIPEDDGLVLLVETDAAQNEAAQSVSGACCGSAC